MNATSRGDRQLFAVVPAAGHSRRMGRPKLLLPLGGRTVVRRLVDALAHSEIARTYVVVRRDDEPLIEEVEGAGAHVVRPDVDPPDMRASVQAALEAIESELDPHDDDGWLLVPADHPVLDRDVVGTILAAWRESTTDVLIPTHAGRRGHPTVFRWSMVERVRQLPADQGLNALVRDPATEVVEVPVDDPAVLADLDTPEDYEDMLARHR